MLWILFYFVGYVIAYYELDPFIKRTIRNNPDVPYETMRLAGFIAALLSWVIPVVGVTAWLLHRFDKD